MRALFFATAILFVTPVCGALIGSRSLGHRTDFLGKRPAENIDIRVEIAPEDLGTPNVWHMLLDGDDVGVTHSLTAATADGFGVDWLLWQAQLDESIAQGQAVMHIEARSLHRPGIDTQYHATSSAVPFDVTTDPILRRVDVTLLNWDPSGDVWTQIDVYASIPEPSTLLLLLGILHVRIPRKS